MRQLSLSIKENLVYAGLWIMAALAPILTMTIKTMNHVGTDFDWVSVLHVWAVYAIFFVPFVLHNHLLAPLLIYSNRARTYFIGTAILLLLFFAFQRWQRPTPPEDGRKNRVEMVDRQKSQPEAISHMRGHIRTPFFFEQIDLFSTFVLLLILGMNLGIKLFFKQEGDKKQMAELEHKNLEHQLKYLKYQVNPHFFMNTLNNIHALVDIDPERAKKCIVVLSRMMRYLLYDGNSRFIPLEKEISFLNHYIMIMRMRYTDHVRISISVPEQVPEAQIPPLVLFTFLENAFKHGISYLHDSFIDLTITIEGERLHLRCVNSRADRASDVQGGVGLTNLCQRLSLIYGDNWQCDVNDTAKTYEANLQIPLTTTFSQSIKQNDQT